MTILKALPTMALFMCYVISAKAQVKVGQKAIDFTAYQADGDSVTLSDNKSYVLLSFSMYACAPCWESYPHLTELQDKYKEALKIITFHVDETPDRWDAQAKKLNLRVNWLSVRDVKDKKEVVRQYDLQGFPQWFLIDRNGIIVEIFIGYKKNKLDNLIDKYLGT